MTTIELPWPDPRLFPNMKRKLHWREYNKPAQIAKQYAFAIALQAGARGKITEIAFHPPNRIHRDDDGMIGAVKHYRDGIAEATKVDDRHFRPQYTFHEPVAGGKIVVTVGE